MSKEWVLKSNEYLHLKKIVTTLHSNQKYQIDDSNKDVTRWLNQ